MSGVRVIVTITTENAEAVEAALPARVERCRRVEETEEGCLQYEMFRSAVRPERMVLLEHWSSLEIYDRHWTSQIAREGLPARRPGATSTAEFYPYEKFEVVDGIWVPSDRAARSETIRWAP